MTGGLDWGRRFLMCPPTHFGVLYEINPWMSGEVIVDPDRARAQWDTLVATLEEAGAHVEVLEAQADLPDLVFTANAGIVNASQFVPARFKNPERQAETPHDEAWFADQGFDIDRLGGDGSHEGAGDALPFVIDAKTGPAQLLLSGYRWRTDISSHEELSRVVGAPVRSIELVNERLYHLDLTFCTLDDRRAIVAPDGWDDYGRRLIKELVADPLVLDLDEALGFAANSIVVGDRVIMPSCPPRVGRQLEAWGFAVAVVEVSEFLKAGGACRCLTLALDVDLNPRDPHRP